MLERLRRDHRSMHQLLCLLQRSANAIRAGEFADLNLMAQAVDYLGHYADIHHHPVEDTMLGHFYEHGGQIQALIAQCEREHANLAAKTQQLLVPLHQVLLDGVVPMAQLLDNLDAFLAAEQAHLDFEEGVLFPALEEIASAADWQRLQRKVYLEAADSDSRFDSDYYHQMYDEIAQQLAS
ncbi:MAG: hemerythrin domain-containing protein [Pseudomonadales bacterium]